MSVPKRSWGYAQRNRLLAELGYPSYNDYLSSVLWAEIKDTVLHRDNYRCVLCGAETRTVHHINYNAATLLGESLDPLVSVCKTCHAKIEFTEDNKKRSVVAAQKAYRKLRNSSVADSTRHCSARNCKNQARKNQKYCGRCTRRFRPELPRCACGNFCKRNRQTCKRCEPSKKVLV